MVYALAQKSPPVSTEALPPLPIDAGLWQAVAQAMELSPQHTKVVELVLRGLCDKQIAAEMGIRKSTLRTYLDRIFIRTGAKGRIALLRKVLTLSHQLAK